MRRADEIELALAPRPPGHTLQQWLYAQLRLAILSGALRPGQRLPASRELARQQQVARGTVLAVYAQLTDEGYLTGQIGSGTVVSHTLPELPARVARPSVSGERPGRLAGRAAPLANSPFARTASVDEERCFRSNQPDTKTFPLALWNRIAAQRGNFLRPGELVHCAPEGYLPLRRALAERLRSTQRIACDAAQVMILGSAQQALDLCARLLLDPGDAVWLEEPGYPGARDIFRAAGARIAAVPVDGQGLMVEQGVALAPHARLAYVSAAHQAPMGVTLSLERRLALLAWARAQNATILEDDYDGEFRYAGTPLAALKSLDGEGRVIYMGTFSKLLFPSLRLAYVVVPAWLIDAFASAISLTCRHVPVPPQRVLAEFIEQGHFARHVRRMREIYAGRAYALQQACASRLGGMLSVLPVTTGLNATALLPQACDDRAVAAGLAGAGIETTPLSFYTHPGAGGAPLPGLVLGFSAFDHRQIEQGVRQMEPVLTRLLAGPAD